MQDLRMFLRMLGHERFLIQYKTVLLFPRQHNLDLTILKACADAKIDLAQVMISVFDRVEKIVEKRRNCMLHGCSPFPKMFLRSLFFTVVKTCDPIIKD